MKIAWFTPFSKGSAIGRAGRGIVAELSRICDVDLCHFDAGETLDTIAPAKAFRSAADISDTWVAKYDLLIYNFGNYLPYHREIFQLSRRYPGLTILHDFVMHHFFAAYYLEELRDPTGYILLMSRVYGKKGAALAQKILDGATGRVWETGDVAKYPLFEEIVQGALGVVTHSGFFREKVESVFAGPVRRIPLAYDCDTKSPVRSRADLNIDPAHVLIVTVGHINPNKTVESAIEALDELGSLSGRVTYAIVGPCSPEYLASLQSLVRAKNLERSVIFPGAVSDEVLRAYLRHADFCINLRFPATEGASASAIEEMLFGKPVIVNNVGFFTELPDDCAIKIDPSRRSELTRAMKRLVVDQDLRRDLGDRARVFAEQEFRSDRYAAQILDFASVILRMRPLLELSDGVARELNKMGVMRDSAIVAKTGGLIEDLFVRHRPDPILS